MLVRSDSLSDAALSLRPPKQLSAWRWYGRNRASFLGSAYESPGIPPVTSEACSPLPWNRKNVADAFPAHMGDRRHDGAALLPLLRGNTKRRWCP